MKRLMRALRSGSALLILPGLLFAIPGIAGTIDMLSHGKREVGTGTLFDPYTFKSCAGAGKGCKTYHGVHVRFDQVRNAGKVKSEVLYDLVRSHGNRVHARLKEDTFRNRIDSAYVDGRWYTTNSDSYWLLLLTVPLLVAGLVLIALGLVPLGRAIGRKVTGRTRRRRWAWLVAGLALFAFCVALTSEGMSGGSFSAGPGQLSSPYAEFGSTGMHQGVKVHVDQFGTVHEAESPELFALLRTPEARVRVEDVVESTGSGIASVTHRGREYTVEAPEDWMALVVVVPIALIALAAIWLNARALRAA